MPRSPRYFLASGAAVHVQSSRELFSLTKLLSKSALTFFGVFGGFSGYFVLLFLVGVGLVRVWWKRKIQSSKKVILLNGLPSVPSTSRLPFAIL